ncbi:MAG TPA: HAMP domain-containing sensor histidine kinase [Solirubrobacteraceae bacterium]|nr:HAMP domain-containing sensor histidine kinase [Solirubrobacteraceae bacterium]
MRARPRLVALGLRGRIVGVVVLCTVATLSVAAIALLGPLESSLRKAAENTLKTDLRNATGKFRSLHLAEIALASPPATSTDAKGGPQAAAVTALEEQGVGQRRALYRAIEAVTTRTGAGPNGISLRAPPDQTGVSQPVLVSQTGYIDPDTAVPAEDAAGSFGDVTRAAQLGKTVYTEGTLGGKDVARAAIPLKDGYILAVRKDIDEIPGAVHAVRQAFLYAVLAGLGLSLILGIPLAARLVRRLQNLRVTALKIADGGQPVEVPEDRVRDEVGDLGRSFAVMQRRLRHQEEARRAFVATASHELRTPLTSLEGMLELLDDDLRHGTPDLQDARSLLASARAQSRRLGRLAADLLDLSRIDAEVELRSEPIELGELCRAVIAEFDLGTRARGVRAGLEEARASIWALGDPGSVARILRILLDNAVRVSPSGTEVTVELDGEPVPRMSVRDRGPGVDEAERELIFERFHRGRATGGDAGFGLGLAIGRELAERMGGTLELDAPDGAGARFTLTLPVARATEEDHVLTA